MKFTLAFEVEFLSELEMRSFFEFSSSSKVKILTFLAFSSKFEFRDCFTKVLGSFELILDTVLLLLGEKTIEHCPSEFLGIILVFRVRFLV